MIPQVRLLHSSVNNTADVKPSLIYGENRADGNALEEENKSITLIYDTTSESNVKSSAVSRWIAGTRRPKNGYTFKFFTNND